MYCMIDNAEFINNIIITCRTDEVIREDGKALRWWNRLADYFRGAHTEDRFQTSCIRLIENSLVIGELPPADRLNIATRYRQIAQQLQGDNKEEINSYVDQIEKLAFGSPHDVHQIADPILQELVETNKARNSRQRDRAIQKFEFLVRYVGGETPVLSKIMNKWIDFDKGTNTDVRFATESDRALTQRIFTQVDKNLGAAPRDNKTLKEYLYLSTHLLKHAIARRDFIEVQKHLQNIQKILSQLGDKHPLVRTTLNDLQEVLTSNKKGTLGALFISSSEMDKELLAQAQGLFLLFNQYIHLFNPKKILEIKLRLANLPAPGPRENYPNLVLTQKEQLEILVARLQSEENQHVSELAEFLIKHNPAAVDAARLATFVGSKSALSPENRDKLRAALVARLLPQALVNWDDWRGVRNALRIEFLQNPGQTPLIQQLKREIKAKTFFQSQVDLDESMILIPRWYHATSQRNITGILSGGKIEVRHEKAFSGAWVASQREQEFGEYVISLGQRVENIDPRAKIGYEYFDKRWRGLQKAIPLTEQNLLIGVPNRVDKEAQKSDKIHTVRLLKREGLPVPQALTVRQVDFMQKFVQETLGNPNLNDAWWGSGSVHSQHQVDMQKLAQTVPVRPGQFTPKSDSENQMAIAEMVQHSALPLYKRPMPPNPSYAAKKQALRVGLQGHSGPAQGQFEAQVAKGEATARTDHGTMHSTRVVLWTQVLRRVYEKFEGLKLENPILTAAAAAYHDTAREAEGPDHWDGESAELFKTLLQRTDLDEATREKYVQTIREKDPEGNKFTTLEQRIVHDADCLDIIRIHGRWGFDPHYLQFYPTDPEKKKYADQLIAEIGRFIQLTERKALRVHLEHNSQDFYGDLVRILFAARKQFPLLTGLVENDMALILQTPETPTSKKALEILGIK